MYHAVLWLFDCSASEETLIDLLSYSDPLKVTWLFPFCSWESIQVYVVCLLPLQSFSLADNFKQQASALLKQVTDYLDYSLTPVPVWKHPPLSLQPPAPSPDELKSVDFNEVKRGVAFILDHSPLFTPSCLVYITQRVSILTLFLSLQ